MTENVNPIFNDVLIFPCAEVPQSIEVKAKHDNFFRGNEVLGKAEFPLNVPRADLEQGIDEWVPLNGKTGMVRLHVKFEPQRKVAAPERSLIGELPGKAGRKFNVAGKKGLKSSIRAGFKVTVLAAKLLLKRMKERKLKGKGLSMLTIFVTTLGIFVTTKKTKAITNRKIFEEDEIEEKDNVLVQCIKALIDKLMDALSVCAIEVQRLGTKGKLKCLVIGGLPPPYPAWFELSIGIELKTDSVQNLNDAQFSLGDQPFNLNMLHPSPRSPSSSASTSPRDK